MKNTGAGPVLTLTTKSTAAAPFATNAKGKVANLFADRAATADNSSKLGGQTLAQVRSGGDAGTLGGQTLAQVRSGGDAATVAGKTVAEITSYGRAHGVVNGIQSSYVATSNVAVSRVSAGIYCITVVGVTPAGGDIVATPDFATDTTRIGDADLHTLVEVDSSSTDCLASQFEVRTLDVTPANIGNATEQNVAAADSGFSFLIVGSDTTAPSLAHGVPLGVQAPTKTNRTK